LEFYDPDNFQSLEITMSSSLDAAAKRPTTSQPESRATRRPAAAAPAKPSARLGVARALLPANRAQACTLRVGQAVSPPESGFMDCGCDVGFSDIEIRELKP
jgi:hypothetical protein